MCTLLGNNALLSHSSKLQSLSHRPSTVIPTERCSGCPSCFARVVDLRAKKLLEVVGQHTWRTPFDNFANLGRKANAAEARQASHAGQHDIDDKPFDVIVCTLRHDEVSN